MRSYILNLLFCILVCFGFATQASAQVQTYYYTGPAWSISQCTSATGFGAPPCSNGFVSASVTLTGVTAGYSGHVASSQIAAYSLNANGGGIGSISSLSQIDELAQAIWEDIKALQDLFGVRFVTGAQLIIPSTNEYGDPLIVRHPDGRILHRYHTHYYRPACLDYEL